LVIPTSRLIYFCPAPAATKLVSANQLIVAPVLKNVPSVATRQVEGLAADFASGT
jgi:hypothetical protein